jgi:hypothetical protein
MTHSRSILAETTTPDGVRVVIFADTWFLHILDPHDGHPELESYLPALLATVIRPDAREPDPRRSRERFFNRHAGPSEWLMVVVDFLGEPPRIVTPLGYRQSPSDWTS